MIQKSGIYKITNLINNMIYIGSSVNLQRRKNTHFEHLKANKHHSRYLQRSYNKYGHNNFKFEILEYVSDENKLIEYEQFYLDIFEPEYNTLKIAGSALGYKHTEEAKQKISKNNAKNMLGKKHSKETRRKLSISHIGVQSGENNPTSKLTEKEVLKIKELLINGGSPTVIAKLFNVKRGTIVDIKYNRTWKNTGINLLEILNKPKQLTELEVVEIKRLLSSKKHTQKEISQKYDVTPDCISRINTGNRWSHINISEAV